MAYPDLCGAAALLGMIAYAVLAGADFGGGVWDALASGPRKDTQRQAIAHAMGPVWEANHVWLIFVLVIFFTCFPAAFADYMRALFIPLHLVLVGITLRGVGFVFRAYSPERGGARPWGIVFGVASIFTPVLLGMSVGALSSGGTSLVSELGAPEVFELPWLTPIAVALGGAGLSLCAYMAAVFLTLETKDELQEDYRRRALVAGGVVFGGSVITLPLTYLEAPHLWAGLMRPHVVPIVAVGLVVALASGWLLWHRHYKLARAASVLQVTLVLVGWALAQYPYILYPRHTLASSASPDSTLQFVLLSLPVGMTLLIPSLAYLFRVFKRRELASAP